MTNCFQIYNAICFYFLVFFTLFFIDNRKVFVVKLVLILWNDEGF